MRREAPADLHMTIAFFGAVDEANARAAFAAISTYPIPDHANVVRLGPLGSKRRPSVIAAIVEDATLTAALAALRDPLYDAAGVPRDTRPALPHVTVARFGRRATDAERREGIRWAESVVLAEAPIAIEPVALYRTATAPGTKYERV